MHGPVRWRQTGLSLLLCQCVDDAGECMDCLGSHFIIRGVLDWMGDKDIARIFHAKGTALKIGSFLEL